MSSIFPRVIFCKDKSGVLCRGTSSSFPGRLYKATCIDQVRSLLSFTGTSIGVWKTRLAVCVRSRGSKIDPTCPLLMKHDVSNVLRGLGIIAISFAIRWKNTIKCDTDIAEELLYGRIFNWKKQGKEKPNRKKLIFILLLANVK